MFILSHLTIILFDHLFPKKRTLTDFVIGNSPGFDVEDTDQQH